jgi:hypothetical protein
MSLDSRPAPKTAANAWVALQVDESKFFTSFVEDLKQLFKTAELSWRRDTQFQREVGYLNRRGKIKPVSLTKVKNNDDYRAA